MMLKKLGLELAKVVKIKQVPLGDRCCIDFVGNLEEGEGMLVGMIANGLFFIHSETLENPFTNTRPFRVNAGPVSAYTLVPGEENGDFGTKYLCELRGGDRVLVVDLWGNHRVVEVARNKIESRPLILIEVEIEGKKKFFPKAIGGGDSGRFHTFVQNAETILLAGRDRKLIPAPKLKEGDEVITWVKNPELLGRHFGITVEERIIEQ